MQTWHMEVCALTPERTRGQDRRWPLHDAGGQHHG